jgi:hypothetical protein
VIVEVGAYLIRHAERHDENWISVSTLAGLVLGLGVMYVTALLVKI